MIANQNKKALEKIKLTPIKTPQVFQNKQKIVQMRKINKEMFKSNRINNLSNLDIIGRPTDNQNKPLSFLDTKGKSNITTKGYGAQYESKNISSVKALNEKITIVRV